MKIFRGAALATTIAGSLLAGNAQAVNISTDGIGEVATAPYYTARDDWETLINLTNTATVPILVKVRVHESLNSRDVFDFTVGLSANDVFSGIIREENGRPVFTARDKMNNKTVLDVNGDGAVDEKDQRVTCTVPRGIAEGLALDTSGAQPTFDPTLYNNQGPSVPFSEVATSGDGVSAGLAIERMKEGYIEFIVMGYADNNEAYNGNPIGDAFDAKFTTDANNATASAPFARATEANGYNGNYINVYDAIENHDCGALELALDETANPRTGEIRVLETAQQMGEPLNALKFNFRLINQKRGIEAGLAAVAWANFFNPGDAATGTNAATAVDGEISPADNFDTGLALGGALGGPSCATYRGKERLTSDDYGDNPLTSLVKEGGQEARRDFDWLPGEVNIAGSCQNLLAPQVRFGFLEPTFNDAYPVVAKIFDDATNEFVVATPSEVTTTPDAAAVADDGRGTAVPLGGGNLRGIDAVSATIMTASLLNEWVANVDSNGFGTTSDWIVTQPTKSFYVDRDLFASPGTDLTEVATRYAGEGSRRTNDLYAAINADNANETNLDASFPFAPYIQEAFADNPDGSAGAVANAKACMDVLYDVYDRAEQQPQVINPAAPPSGVVVSPQPPEAPTNVNPFQGPLCYETSVVTFNGKSALPPESAVVLNRFDVVTNKDLGANAIDADFNSTNGWMRLYLDVEQSQAGNAIPGLPLDMTSSDGTAAFAAKTETEMGGLPVIGFMLKVRTFEGSTSEGFSGNYASTLQHATTRAFQ